MTRSRTAADSTNDEASTTGATPDDARTLERNPRGRRDRQPVRHGHHGCSGPRPPTPPISSGRMALLRVKEVKAVTDDIASTARRRDAVMYWGGLAGLAAVIILERPAAGGVGVAAERRRARPHRATT